MHVKKLVQEIDYIANLAILKKNHEVTQSLTNDLHLMQNEVYLESV